MQERFQGESLNKMAEENDQSGNNNSDTILPSESNFGNGNASPEPKNFMEELVSKIDSEIANGDYIAVEEIEVGNL